MPVAGNCKKIHHQAPDALQDSKSQRRGDIQVAATSDRHNFFSEFEFFYCYHSILVLLITSTEPLWLSMV